MCAFLVATISVYSSSNLYAIAGTPLVLHAGHIGQNTPKQSSGAFCTPNLHAYLKVAFSKS